MRCRLHRQSKKLFKLTFYIFFNSVCVYKISCCHLILFLVIFGWESLYSFTGYMIYFRTHIIRTVVSQFFLHIEMFCFIFIYFIRTCSLLSILLPLLCMLNREALFLFCLNIKIINLSVNRIYFSKKHFLHLRFRNSSSSASSLATACVVSGEEAPPNREAVSSPVEWNWRHEIIMLN